MKDVLNQYLISGQQSHIAVQGEYAGSELVNAYAKGVRDFHGSVIVGEADDHPLMQNPYSDFQAFVQLNVRVLSEMVLDGINLANSAIEKIFFGATRFQSSSFRHSSIINAEFTDCDLRGADLSFANFLDCYFIEADLSGADLTGASFKKCDLSGCKLVGAKWKDADLSGAILDCVDW